MPNTTVHFNVKGIEIKPEDMDLFMKFHIIEPNGTFNMAKYQKWFMYSIEKKTEKDKSPEAIVKATAQANLVKNKILEERNQDKSVLGDNGGMADHQYIGFLLKRANPEDVKKLTMGMIHDTLKNNKDNNNGNDDKDGDLDDVVTLILPVVENAQETGGDKKANDTLDYFEKELEKDGFKRKDIEDKIKIRKTKIEAKKENLTGRKKDEPFNIYMDWRYLYYMYILRADTRRIERENMKKLFGVGKTNNEKYYYEVPIFPKTTFDMPYAAFAFAFEKRYNMEFDLEDLRNHIIGIKNDKDYKVFFKDTITNLYNQAKDRVIDITEFMDDMDGLFQSISDAEGGRQLPKYGGMEAEECRNFMLGLRSPDFCVSDMMEKEIIKTYGTNGKDDAALLASYIHKQFMEKMNSDDPKEQFNLMREAMAQYLILKNAHEERGIGYMLRHPFKYNAEANALKDIENTMNDCQDQRKQAMIDDLRDQDKIYKAGFEREFNNIRTRSMQIDIDNFEVIGNDGEPLARRPSMVSVNQNQPLKHENPIPVITNEEENNLPNEEALNNPGVQRIEIPAENVNIDNDLVQNNLDYPQQGNEQVMEQSAGPVLQNDGGAGNNNQ